MSQSPRLEALAALENSTQVLQKLAEAQKTSESAWGKGARELSQTPGLAFKGFVNETETHAYIYIYIYIYLYIYVYTYIQSGILHITMERMRFNKKEDAPRHKTPSGLINTDEIDKRMRRLCDRCASDIWA